MDEMEIEGMEKKAKVPKLRFPGFAGDWEERKLGEITEVINRKNAESSAPVMMISAASGFINQSEKYSTDNAGQSLIKYTILKKGELAYNHGASKLRPYGSCFALSIDEARVPFVYHCFSVKENIPCFIALELNSERMDRQLRRLVSSGARMDGLLNISFEDYSSVKVCVTSKKEQIKIVALIEAADKLIDLYQRKLTHLQAKKKCLLQKMFPKKGERFPELRFPGFDGDWEQRKLIDEVDSVDTGKSKFMAKDNGQYEILGSTAVIGYDDNYDYEGDFLLTARVGANAGELYRHSGKVKISDNTVFIQSANLDFIYYLLTNFNIKKLSFGTGQPLVKASELKKLELMLPSDNKEQQKIGEFFKSLDNLITLHERKLAHMQTQKKALLQQMFV